MNATTKRSRGWPLRRLGAVVVLIAAGGFFVYWAFFQREHHRWSEVVTLWNGEQLRTERDSSNKAYHGLVGHFSPFWWGGGDPWEIATFVRDGKQYRWEGPYIPIAIQPDKTDVYLVVFDRETRDYYRPTRFRLYRSTTPTEWEEIDAREFPRHVAIQNTWLRENNGIRNDHTIVNEYAIVAALDPGDWDFRRSLTAKLWNYLEKPAEFSMDHDPSEAFLREYKTKWIKTTDSQPPQSRPSADQPGGKGCWLP